MSSVFEDEQLVDLLLKYGQTAGQYFAVSPEDFNAVRAMISNLEQKLTAPTATTPEITSDVPVSLASPEMKNLSTLINFLYTTGMKVNGKRIVVGANDLPDDPSYLPFGAEGDQTFRPAGALSFKVNKSLLAQYLNSLQGHLSTSPNPVMKAQVDSMIRESNDQLGTTVGKGYEKPVETLDPRAVVDKVPQRILTKTQLYGDGPIPLTFGDLSSDTNFNSWIQTNKITVDDQPQADQCGVLKFLYNRAVNKITNATSAQAKSVASLYQKQLTQLATAFKCDLGVSGKTEPAAHAPAAAPAATLAQLVSILPLQRDVLDFGRIRDFINKYRGMATATTDPNRLQQISAAMDLAEQYMQAATRMTASQSQTTFSMDGLSANDIIQWATPPDPAQAARSRGSARALADYLEQVVRQVYIMLKDVYNSHYQLLQDRNQPGMRELDVAIQQQVGGPSIPFGSSLASSNMSDIQVARARLPQVGA